MKVYFTRRNFLSCGTGALLTATQLRSQTPQIPVAEVTVKEYKPRSTVALIRGENRRKNVHDALVAIDDQIRAKLKTKKSVIIKPNDVSPTNQLASTHADAICGILDYLMPRFKGPIVIAESSGDTWTGFNNFNYPQMIKEFKSRKIELIDLNEEGKFVHQAVLDQDAHIVPVRLAARLFDRDAFIISSALLKSHNYAVASLGVKNMVLGAPLRSAPTSKENFNHKASYHAGFHLIHYNMVVTAQSMQPFWGVSLIDGFEGMEGNGPVSGTPVESKLAIASTDFIAADRVGVECMGVDPKWVGYLQYCNQIGLGNYDRAKIDIIGPSIASVQKTYLMNSDIEREMKWIEPFDVEDGSWIGPRGRRTDGRPTFREPGR